MSDKKKLLPFLILGGFAIVAVGGGIFIKAISTPKTTGFGEKTAQMMQGEEGEGEMPEELARSRRAQQGGQFSDVNYGQSTLGMVKGFFANLFGDKKKGKTDAETASQEQGQPQSVPDPAELMKKMGGQGKMGQGLGEAGGKFGSVGPQTMAGATGESAPNAFGEKVTQSAEGDKLQTGQSRTQVGGGKKAATSKKFLSGLGRALGFGGSKGAVGKGGSGSQVDVTQYAKAQYKFESSAVKPGSPQTGIFVDPNKAMGMGEEDSGDTGSQSPGGQEDKIESGGARADDSGFRMKDHDESCELEVQVTGPKGKDCGKVKEKTFSGSDGWGVGGSNDCRWSRKGEQVDVGLWNTKSPGLHRQYFFTYESDGWWSGDDGKKYWKLEYNDSCQGKPILKAVDSAAEFKELVKDQLYMFNKCMYDSCKYKTNWDSDVIFEECYKKWPQVVEGDNLGWCGSTGGSVVGGAVAGVSGGTAGYIIGGDQCDQWPEATPKSYEGSPNLKIKVHTLGAKTFKVATGGLNHQEIAAQFKRIDSCGKICDDSTGIRICP